MLGLALAACTAVAQDCPAVARVAPVGTTTGSLGATSCLLTDGTLYQAYRLDLPVRGALALDVSGTTSDLQIILRTDSGSSLAAGAGIRRQVEAGSYTLLVNGKPGAFTVTSAFTAEPSMLCSGFPAIGPRQTVTATLGAYGCMAPDGTPYDGWSLTTYGGGVLTVTITSSDFTPAVTLRGSDGRALATSANGILAAPVQADSTYTLVAASSDNGGSYQIATSFQNASDDTCNAVRGFTDADTDAGTINAASCFVTLPGSGDLSYYNYYNLTLASPGAVAFQVSSGDFVPTLYLLDEAGNMLAVDSLGAGYDSSGNARSYLRTVLPAGNYVLQVFSDVASGGAYSVQYTLSTEAPSPCAASALTPGDLATGALSTSSCRTSMGGTDLFSVTLPSSGTLDLDLSALDFPAILAIRDVKDNQIVRSEEVDGVSSAHITADLPAGTYTIAAGARSYAGAYRLATKFTGHDLAPCTFTQSIALNGGYIQRLGATGCKGVDGQAVDYYGFTLAADSMVLGVVTSSEVDGFLTLLDSSGNVLRSDDNGYGGLDPLIVQYVPAGSYKIAVRDPSGNAGGLYEIDLRTVDGPRPPFCGVRGTISPGGSVTGNVSYTGCQYTDQTFADIYQIDLAVDSTLDVRLNSSDFDAYLVILDAKGNVVDEDDDGGGNTNARTTTALRAGVYYIVAKPFGDYLSHGNYTLAAAVAQ